jgi:uncharacterized protein DUF397
MNPLHELRWRKSSYSSDQANCVEVAHAGWQKSSHSTDNANCVEVAHAGWQKSSHSTDQANCVEIAHTGPAVAVRDSKNAPGPTLTFPAESWSAFLR